MRRFISHHRNCSRLLTNGSWGDLQKGSSVIFRFYSSVYMPVVPSLLTLCGPSVRRVEITSVGTSVVLWLLDAVIIY
jgi:hypothetical protein